MLISDPFFDALHRRHPDVDLVVLPASRPPATAELVGDDVVAEVLARITVRARHLWAAAAPESDDEPHAIWCYAADPGRVRAVARLTGRRHDGFPLLVSLRHELERNGWDLTRPPGAVERLVGSIDDLKVSASYAEQAGTLVFAVTSASLAVGADRARALVRAQAGER